MNTRTTWVDRHPIFMRFYVPVVVTATFLLEAWDRLR